MTLVVGYADKDIGFLVGDTLLSYPVEQYNPREPFIEKFHALKIQILTPDVAVAFAGDVQLSLSILKQLSKDLVVSPQLNIPQRLLELHLDYTDQPCSLRQSSDFLVLLITPEKTKKLAHISDGRVDYVQRAYIGDSVEYANFKKIMELYSSPTICHIHTDGENEFDQVSDAMEILTRKRRSETVGAICGCVTRVVDARISGKLEYMQCVEASVSPAEGDGGFSLLASNVGVIRGIAIYYRGWKTGLIFIVIDEVTCRMLAASTIEEFIELARNNYGLNLEGGVW